MERVGKVVSPLAPLCKGELLLQCEALPTIEGLLAEVSEKRKEFIIIAHLGKVNGSYRIVTISLALSNRFSGRRTLPGSNGTFNVIFRFSLLTNCVVMDYNYVRSV